jgi:hypothetical protein
MLDKLKLGLITATLTLALVACGSGALTAEQATDRAWEALDPHTSSHDRLNWQVVDVRQVQGREVAETFEREQPRCIYPTPQPNEAVRPGSTYWYVEMKPNPATPLPTATLSPTAPPFIPEPFVRDAFFLIDPSDGHVVARMLFCVIY